MVGKIILFCLLVADCLFAQVKFKFSKTDSIPSDIPIPKINYTKNPTDGYIFATIPYWGKGNNYLVIYNNNGKPVFYRKTKSTCTDFKLNSNGLLTYFDYYSKKFYAMDSTMTVVDSFSVRNGLITDEHDIKFLKNGNVLLIGLDYKLVDMSSIVNGGSRNASVVVNLIQEIDKNKNVVFEWKAYENYKYIDTAPYINLSDQAFVHSHINSIDLDRDDNLIISARNLDEISKVDRKTGKFIWRFGGKNNQFKILNDSTKFSAQHSATVLANGNILVYDNGTYNNPPIARAVEYKLDETSKTAIVVWKYSNTPFVQSKFWGNAQRLSNGNTFVAWGMSNLAATEVNSNGDKTFEMEFPADVFSYRLFRFSINNKAVPVKSEINTPENYFLSQNYPNPFNPSTVISYQISAASHVTLKVYDILGREVATLINETKQPGTYNTIFNASNFEPGITMSGQSREIPSGIYFYRLQANNFSQIKKMMFIK